MSSIDLTPDDSHLDTIPDPSDPIQQALAANPQAIPRITPKEPMPDVSLIDPQNNWLLVQAKLLTDEATGIILPEGVAKTSKEDRTVTVLRVGPGRWYPTENGGLYEPMPVKEGDECYITGRMLLQQEGWDNHGLMLVPANHVTMILRR